MPKIYLSPENRPAPHGPYAGFSGIYEHNVCCEIAELERIELERCGFDVTVAAPNSTMVDRVKFANTNKFDLYQTLHTNAGGGTGAEVLYYNSPVTKKACQCVYDELVKLYPSKRGLKDGTTGYYEIYQTNMVSVYPEIAFHDNISDVKFILDNKKEIAKALCKGICAYWGIQYKDSEYLVACTHDCKACKSKILEDITKILRSE